MDALPVGMTMLLARKGASTRCPREGRQELMFLEFHQGQYTEIFIKANHERINPPTGSAVSLLPGLIVDDIDETLNHLAVMDVHPQRPAR